MPKRGDAGSEAARKRVLDPEEWDTRDEPMTAAQRAYLERLSKNAEEPMPEQLTKAEASKRIEVLRQQLIRGARPRKRPD